MSGFRHDTSLSDDDFTKQILQLITKDEKGQLLKLVNQIAGAQVLQQATTAGLISSANSSLLGEAISTFRNSIVHGKVSHGYDLQSTSVISESATFPLWRAILRSLARQAISAFGSKLF
jgi:glutamine synthetase adenylyltransferase